MRKQFIAAGVIILGFGATANAEVLHGRIFDSMEEKVFAHARVILRSENPIEATADDLGVYRFADVRPGAYLVKLDLGDYGTLVARVVVNSGAPTLHHFDISKIENPHADHGY